MSRILIAMIRAYQYAVSPMLGARCKYYPSCSAYTLEAIKVHGPLKGVAMGAWRVLRCNPFSNGGFDPVPPKRA